jgi:hypothetical protein
MAIGPPTANPRRLGISVGNKKPHLVGLIVRPPHLATGFCGRNSIRSRFDVGGRLVEGYCSGDVRIFNVPDHNC